MRGGTRQLIAQGFSERALRACALQRTPNGRHETGDGDKLIKKFFFNSSAVFGDTVYRGGPKIR